MQTLSPASPHLGPFPALCSLMTNSRTQEPDLRPHPEHVSFQASSVLCQNTVCLCVTGGPSPQLESPFLHRHGRAVNTPGCHTCIPVHTVTQS